MQNDHHEHELEDLLRQVFDEARREGRRDLTGVHAAAAAEAARLRRRHRQRVTLGGAGGALVAATVVAAVVLVSGATGPTASRLRPAGPTRSATESRPAVTSAPAPVSSVSNGAGATSSATPAPDGSAYEIPDVLPTPLPAGLRDMTGAMPTSEPELMGNLGGCNWTGEVRKPVAGREWQLTDAKDSGWLAGLSIAGFTTGTGEQAMKELLDHRLECQLGDGVEPVAWPGKPDNRHLLASSRVGDGDQLLRPRALAVIQTGDLLVSAFAHADSVPRARATATDLAERAAAGLKGFPPAEGAALGTSTEPPNAASAPGVVTKELNGWANAYDFGDVYPTVEQLGHGMSYKGGAPITGPRTPAASGAQICDSTAVAEAKGETADTSPLPIAGTQNSAWSGGGGANDPNVTISVTGWKKGTGAARFRDLQEDRGFCVWMPEQSRVAWPGADPSRTWLSRSAPGQVAVHLASQRVGDVIVSVVVMGMPEATARAEAIRLSDLVAGKVRDSGLPAAEGK